jgi:hypothetical protein
MKPTRKISRRSFVTLVSGGYPPVGGPKGEGGQGKSAVESDHDLIHPGPPGGDPDSRPR